MFTSKLGVRIVMMSVVCSLAACTGKPKISTEAPIGAEGPEQDTQQPPASTPITSQPPASTVNAEQADENSAIRMNFPKKSLESYGLNPETLFYTASFTTEQGQDITTISRTKLEFVVASSRAEVVMKVKRGSRGKVILNVEDTSDDAKYTGQSQVMTVEKDGVADVVLKKVGGIDPGTDEGATVSITIDRNSIDQILNPDNGTVTIDISPDEDDSDDTSTDDTDDDTQNVSSSISYKRYEETLTTAQLSAWRETDQTKRGDNARYWKYVYIDSEFYGDPDTANLARVGVFKALNHVAINNTEIFLGEDVSEQHGLVFAFDLRSFFGPDAAKAERKWQILSRADRRAKSGMISAPSGGRLRAFSDANMMAASRLVFNLTFPDIYNQLIDTPSYEREFLRANGVSFNEAEAWTAQKDSIVFGSRISALRRTGDGRAYWASADDFDGREGNPVPHLSRYNIQPGFRRVPSGMVDRPDAGTIASEAWVEMKNGLIAYYIWGNAGQERGRAELFVIDPRNVAVRYGHKYLETGRSCITCHVAGVQAAPSDVATAIKNGTLTGSKAEEAKRYWTTNEKLDELYSETATSFAKAMTTIVAGISDGSETFNREVVVGAQKEPVLMLLEKIDNNR